MTDGYALLRAIEADPDEDTTRLVYADWLEEHATSDADRGRAEFIRLQCATAREPPGKRKRRTELAEREHQLLDWHHKEWESAFPFHVPTGSYTRGFIYPTFSAGDFAKYGEQLAALMPLNIVRLTDARKAMTRLAACPALQCVRHLYFEGSTALQNRHLSVLLGSPHQLNVSLLGLLNNFIGSPGCEALAATTALPALRVLALGGNQITDRGLDALMGAPWFANLVGLYVGDCGLTAAAVVRLAELPAAKQLRSLNVSNTADADEAARAILESPHLSKLERLIFWAYGFSAPVREALRARFGANLDPPSYRLDWMGGGGS
jgi:uncharacterized protein (TIGR02996 family)